MDKRKGWLMLLSHSPESEWGDVESFFENMEEGKDKVITVESDVWGKLLTKDLRPSPGDGFAFYHASRAKFSTPDPHQRRPRISLIGTLMAVDQVGQEIKHISVRVERKEFDQIRKTPVIRDCKTNDLFNKCRVMPGPVATFYPVPADVWSEFRRLAGLSAESVGGLETHDADPELTAFEGETKIGFVLQRKREAWLRAAKISAALAASADGRLCCEVPGCGFDFESVYGDIGRDFAEVHHLMPLSDMSSPTVTRLEDLAVVCSNCHRMIHRGGGNRSMTGLIK